MNLIGAALLILALIILIKAIFRSKYVDDFANNLCNLEVKKSTKEVYSIYSYKVIVVKSKI